MKSVLHPFKSDTLLEHKNHASTRRALDISEEMTEWFKMDAYTAKDADWSVKPAASPGSERYREHPGQYCHSPSRGTDCGLITSVIMNEEMTRGRVIWHGVRTSWKGDRRCEEYLSSSTLVLSSMDAWRNGIAGDC